MPRLILVVVSLCALGCGGATSLDKILVAAAANLEPALPELAAQFERESHTGAILSFGSTGNLAQQIEHGAPFDVFLAADREHVEELARRGLIDRDSVRVYARGRLALWIPLAETKVSSLEDLRSEAVRSVAMANPRFAPYGLAAAQALRKAGLFATLEPKIVYAQNVRMAHQYAASGNADAALTALSIVKQAGGTMIEVDQKLFEPIEQAAGRLTEAPRPEEAEAFLEFLLGSPAQDIWRRAGYDSPASME